MHLFYAATRIATVIHEKQRTSFFRRGTNLLASCGEGAPILSAVDGSESVVENRGRSINYSLYGFISESVAPVLAFKGEYLDSATSCYPLGNGYRFYSPVLMRFKSPDSESPFGLGGINAYAFTGGDPMNGSDPTGHINWTKAFSTLGRSYGGKGQVIDGISIFYSEPPDLSGERVLNILAHGQPGIVLGTELGYFPSRLKELLESNKIPVKGQRTHFLVCYSAAPQPSGEPSFIQKWSNITGAETTGYRKGVAAIRSVDGETHHAVVLPVLPGFKQALKLGSKPVTVGPSEKHHRPVRE